MHFFQSYIFQLFENRNGLCIDRYNCISFGNETHGNSIDVRSLKDEFADVLCMASFLTSSQITQKTLIKGLQEQYVFRQAERRYLSGKKLTKSNVIRSGTCKNGRKGNVISKLVAIKPNDT